MMNYVTIGEIANELLQYCKMIELKNVGKLPYLRAILNNTNGFTEAYLYILQIGEDRYSICETNDETYSRYLPMDSCHEPFILERYLINRMWGNGHQLEEGDERIAKDLSFTELMRKIYLILSYYKIIDATSDKLLLPVRELQFSTFRLVRALELIGGDNCSVIDCLIKIKDRTINSRLEGIKTRDLTELFSKFNQMGIILEIHDKFINNFSLEKLHKPRGGYYNEIYKRKLRSL